MVPQNLIRRIYASLRADMRNRQLDADVSGVASRMARKAPRALGPGLRTPCPAAPSLDSPAVGNPSTSADSLGPAVLAHAVPSMAALARFPDHCSAWDCSQMAPTRPQPYFLGAGTTAAGEVHGLASTLWFALSSPIWHGQARCGARREFMVSC